MDSRLSSGKAIFFADSVEIKYYRMAYAVGSRSYDIDRNIQKKIREENNIEFQKNIKNLKRAQRNIRNIINSNLTPHTKFLTLTCKENVLDYKKIKRMFTTFVQAMKREGYVLRYLGVLEHQKLRGLKNGDEGSYHIHLVIFNDEYIPFEIINKHWNGITQIKVLNGIRYNNFEKINSLAWYVCKYITKENYTEYSRHVYFCSKGLNRALEVNIPYYYDIEYDNFILNLNSFLGDFKKELTIKYEFSLPLNNNTRLTQKITTERWSYDKLKLKK